MKLSKLDPMTTLMLVVAFGVVITMLTQTSVASVERTSEKTTVLEKKALSHSQVTTAGVYTAKAREEMKSGHTAYAAFDAGQKKLR